MFVKIYNDIEFGSFFKLIFICFISIFLYVERDVYVCKVISLFLGIIGFFVNL